MSANETRLAGAVFFSVVAHVVLLAALLTWLARPPVYRTPPDDTPTWQVRLVPPTRPQPPRTVAAQKSARSATPHVLSKPATDQDATPIVAGGTPGQHVTGPASPAAEDSDAVARARIRRALRGSAVGCANMERVGLNRQERQHCADIFGEGMGALQRAMREAQQGRLSLGGELPQESEYRAYRDACRATGQRC